MGGMRRALGTGLMLALAALRPARSADYCVDPATGSDTATGRCADRAWATLGPAQSHPFVAGDRVLISAGRHVHPLTAWFMKPGVSWIGAGRDRTFVVYDKSVAVPFVRFNTGSAGSGPPSDLRPQPFTNATVFSDMTLVNEGAAVTGIEIACTSGDSAPTLARLGVTGFPTGIRMHPASDERAAASTHAVITQSIIRGASVAGLAFFADVFYARAVTEGSGATNCSAEVAGVGATVKTLINDMRDAASAVSSPLLTNVTLAASGEAALLLVSYYDDGTGAARIQANGGTTGAAVRGCVLTGSAGHGIAELSPFTEPVAVQDNCLGGNALGDYLDEGASVRAASAVGAGNVSVLPAFVSRATGDLHQLAGSPTIDRIAAASAPATDVDGHARPQGALSDMGSDEWIPCAAAADATATRQGAPCTGQVSTLDATRSRIDAACAAGMAYEWFDGAARVATTAILDVSPSATTTYRLRVSCADPALSACFAETTVDVQPSTAPPSATAGADASACAAPGQSVVFSLSGTAAAAPPASLASTAWTAAAGTFGDASAPVTTLTLTGTGAPQSVTATLRATDDRGCSVQDDVVLTVHPAPVVTIDPVPPTCAPARDPVVLDLTAQDAGGTAPIAHAWSATEGAITGDAPAVLTLPASGVTRDVTVSVTSTDAFGCASSAQRVVRVVPQPVADAGPDVSECGAAGGSLDIALDASGSWGEPPVTYAWSATEGTIADANAAATTLTLPVGALRTVTVTLGVSDDAGACASSDTKLVTVGPGPVADAGADSSDCVATGRVSVPLDGSASAGDPPLLYRWSSDAGTISGSSSPDAALEVDVSATTMVVTVTLEVTDARGGCVARDQRTVELRPRATASAGGPYSALQGAGATRVPLAGAAAGEAPLALLWTTDLGSFEDTGTTTSSLPSPALVVPQQPFVQRGQACLTATTSTGCVDGPSCTEVVVLLVPVQPPLDPGPTLRVGRSEPDDVTLLWQEAPTDATHDAALAYEVLHADRGCGPFARLQRVAAAPGANATADPILRSPPRLRCWFIRSLNDGGASLPAAPDGSACR